MDSSSSSASGQKGDSRIRQRRAAGEAIAFGRLEDTSVSSCDGPGAPEEASDAAWTSRAGARGGAPAHPARSCRSLAFFGLVPVAVV